MNTLIEQTRKEVTDLLNEKLAQGCPISVVNLILENIMFELRDGIKNALAREQEKMQEQQAAQQDQVPYESNKGEKLGRKSMFLSE